MEPAAGLEVLMVRYQRGDLEAAMALIQALSPPLHRFFMVQSVSRRHADDLLQETWMRLHEVRHTYRPGERLLPWVYAIARHVRVDHYRRARRVESREQQVDVLPEPATALRVSDRRPDIMALVTKLPEAQREVVAMLKISNMTLEEVAMATSSTVGAVKQRAHRAYDKLREMLTGTTGGALTSGGRNER